MKRDFFKMNRVEIHVDANKRRAEFEGWRHSLGCGGINSMPLPERVVQGVARLKPRLVRVFIQEYFNVYPSKGTFDWGRLDPYLESVARTGAKVLATVNLKPPTLFPEKSQSAWRPLNIQEYQELIYRLAKRYSAEKAIITHWEHVNEPDIGETGGCPFLLTTAKENYEMYRMMIEPILKAAPSAKVGGPALANVFSPIMEGFIRLCYENNTPLDFVSWHCYHDDLDVFLKGIEHVRNCLKIYGDRQPELMINEMNKGFEFVSDPKGAFDLLSVEEMAYQPRRAAILTRNILGMEEAGVDWTHYYHIWDGSIQAEEFGRFFSERGVKEVMYKHWNEAPLRFGLFSPNTTVRPQYFVYWILSRIRGEKVETACSDKDLTALAVAGQNKTSVLLVNLNEDKVVQAAFTGLKPGLRRLKLYRIDEEKRWDGEKLELLPLEERDVYVLEEFSCQCFSPQDSVVWLVLEEVK